MKALILLSSLGVITLLAEIFSFKKLLFPIVLIGLAATFGLIVNMCGEPAQTYYNMIRFDSISIGFSLIILLIAFLWFIMASDFVNEEENQTNYYALVLFALVGAIIMTSYTNMTKIGRANV